MCVGVSSVYDNLRLRPGTVAHGLYITHLYITHMYITHLYITYLYITHLYITHLLITGIDTLVGAQNYIIEKLQRVQNTAARVISGLRRYDHITTTRYELHWLHVDRRIEFKILLLTYKALNGLAPRYISDLLVYYSEPRELRSRV